MFIFGTHSHAKHPDNVARSHTSPPLLPHPRSLQAAATARAAVPYPSTVQTATSYGDTAGSGQSNFRSIAVDAVTGVTYSAGWCKGTLPIGTLPPLVCLGNSDMLLVKTGPDGTPLKAVNFGSAGGGSYPDGEQVYSMVLSADGKYLFAAGSQVGKRGLKGLEVEA